MITTYETHADFERAIDSRLPSAAIPEDLRRAIIDGLRIGDEQLRSRQEGGPLAELELRVGPWFLRDDDTPYFESAGVIASMVAALVTTGGIALPGAVAAVATLAAATWRVWRKGGRLTPDQTAVLTALEAGGPATESDLARVLVDADVQADVRSTLRELGDVELRDGSAARLVRRTGDGRWKVVGV